MSTQVNTRLKMFLTGFLLCIALGAAVFCVKQAEQAFQRFEQERMLALSGNVSTIRPWMTIPYIARFYNVPASYLDEQLHITGSQEQNHASLLVLANRFNRPIDKVIHDVQQAILNYRKLHPPHTSHIPRSISIPHPKQSPLTSRRNAA